MQEILTKIITRTLTVTDLRAIANSFEVLRGKLSNEAVERVLREFNLSVDTSYQMNIYIETTSDSLVYIIAKSDNYMNGFELQLPAR